MKKHLFYTITRSEKAGAQFHVELLMRHFREHYDISIALGEPGYLSETALSLGIKVHLVPALQRAIRPHLDIIAYRELKSLFQRQAPDLVHSHSFKAGMLSRLAASKLGIPNVFTAHGWPFAYGAPASQRYAGLAIERYLSPRTDTIITVSRSDQDLAEQYNISKYCNVVTISNALPDVNIPAKRAMTIPHLVCTARLAYQKNHDCLLKAVAQLRQPFKLLILGDGPYRRRVEEAIETLNLQNAVELKTDVEDVNQHLFAADIFVLCSRWEGMSISILEAMRAGLPIVASNIDGNRDVVADGSTGILVRPNDPDAFASALYELLQHPQKILELGRAGRKRFLLHYTSDKMLSATHDVYRQLMQ